MNYNDDNAIKIGGIYCCDLGTKEEYAQLETRAERKLKCRWSDRLALINALNPSGTNIGGVIVYQAVPYPGNANLYPQKFKVDGEKPINANANGLIDYEDAIVTVEYRGYRGFDALGYVEMSYGSSVITLGHGASLIETVNSDGNDALAVSQYAHQGLPVTIINICRGRSGVNGFPIEKVQYAATNPINDAPFLNFPAGTVMFNGGRAMRQTATNTGTGIETSTNENAVNPTTLLTGMWQIEYQFIARPRIPWDFLPRWKDGLFDGFAKARLMNGKGPYIGRSDLEQLFKTPNANSANV